MSKPQQAGCHLFMCLVNNIKLAVTVAARHNYRDIVSFLQPNARKQWRRVTFCVSAATAGIAVLALAYLVRHYTQTT